MKGLLVYVENLESTYWVGGPQVKILLFVQSLWSSTRIFQDFQTVVSKLLLSSSFSMSFYEFLRTSRGQLNPVARPAT